MKGWKLLRAWTGLCKSASAAGGGSTSESSKREAFRSSKLNLICQTKEGLLYTKHPYNINQRSIAQAGRCSTENAHIRQ